MSVNVPRFHRRSIRLPKYDYTRVGAYFVTIVVWQREYLLGEIQEEQVVLSPVGEVVRWEWERLTSRFPGIEIDEYSIMPNHVHGIIVIHDTGKEAYVGAQQDFGEALMYNQNRCAPTTNLIRPDNNFIPTVIPGSLGAIVRAFKSSTSFRYHRMRFSNGTPLWQRNYYEHIIRNENDWERIRNYIRGNPYRWDSDRENPNR